MNDQPSFEVVSTVFKIIIIIIITTIIIIIKTLLEGVLDFDLYPPPPLTLTWGDPVV